MDTLGIQPKAPSSVRYVSFNVNGVKTLFNYHPWNTLNNDYNSLFTALNADIITLQELKLSHANISSVRNIGHLDNYRSFISLPKHKKGYSGVGLFVRIPGPQDSPAVRSALTVIKAEEGISGYLSAAKTPYRDSPDGIGGYPDIDKDLGLRLDSEGRCVVVELASNVVVFALYCPANSMGSPEGEEFRLAFLETLLKRAYTLKHNHGKEVVIMGDINVCLDLIDSAEGISDRLKSQLVVTAPSDPGFESINYLECLQFKSSTPARTLLNRYTVPSLKYDMDVAPECLKQPTQFLYDTTRYIQGRRSQMYTVWNTLTSARQSNFGSRIDLILCSCPRMLASVSDADIWADILGSDHCPVFTDFNPTEAVQLTVPSRLDFEAKHYHKLTKIRDISQQFKSRSSSVEPGPKPSKVTKEIINKTSLKYTSRKPVKRNIQDYFFKSKATE